MSRCVLNAGTAARSLAETLTVARRRWPLKVPVAFVEPAPFSPVREPPSNRCEQAPSEPGHGAIAVLSCAPGEGELPDAIENGSASYAAGATIAACVLSTKALTSICSAAGTENLSRVVCTSSMNASHSPGVIAISRWDSSILRPE